LARNSSIGKYEEQMESKQLNLQKKRDWSDCRVQTKGDLKREIRRISENGEWSLVYATRR
jgi:hypothetical protein